MSIERNRKIKKSAKKAVPGKSRAREGGWEIPGAIYFSEVIFFLVCFLSLLKNSSSEHMLFTCPAHKSRSPFLSYGNPIPLAS